MNNVLSSNCQFIRHCGIIELKFLINEVTIAKINNQQRPLNRLYKLKSVKNIYFKQENKPLNVHLKVPETWQSEIEEEGDGQEEEADDAADGVGQAQRFVEVPQIGCSTATTVSGSKVSGRKPEIQLNQKLSCVVCAMNRGLHKQRYQTFFGSVQTIQQLIFLLKLRLELNIKGSGMHYWGHVCVCLGAFFTL